MHRKLMFSATAGFLAAACILAALFSSAGEPPAAGGDAGATPRSARDYFPRNPLVYVQLSGVDRLEERLAGLSLWENEAAGRKEVARLAELAAKQLSFLVGEDDPQRGRRIISDIRSLHLALYPPVSDPPELLMAIEVKDAEGFLKLLSDPLAADRPVTHQGHEIRLAAFSLNGTQRRAAAVAAGSVILLSPYTQRLRQALDVAASGEGALAESPGFDDCRKRYSDRPLWGYINMVGLSSVGVLDDFMVDDLQEILVGLGLPSYRWAGFGSSLGRPPTAFELHLEFYGWSPLARLGPLQKPPDASLAAAVPEDAAFFAAINAGDLGTAWKRLRPFASLLAPDLDYDDEEDRGDKGGRKRDPAEALLAELSKEVKLETGLDLAKDLAPRLSGEIGCFVATGGQSFGMILAARDEAAAGELMAAMKIKDGTVGSPTEDGSVQVARIGRNILITDDEDAAASMLAAVAAGKTLGASAKYRKDMETLGPGHGIIIYTPVGALRQAVGEDWPTALSSGYTAATGLAIEPTGLTLRSTAPVEVAPLMAILPELEGVAADMTRAACFRRLENLGAAAAQFSRGHNGTWPTSLDNLGDGFKAGSPARRCPASGKEYSLVALGTIPPKAANRDFVLCHGAEDAHAERGRTETCVLLIRRGEARAEPLSGPPGTLTTRLAAERVILALADPKRAQLSDEDRKALTSAAADLGNEAFERREAASRRLTELGPKAAQTLLGLLNSQDPEVAERAQNILVKLTGLTGKEEMLRLAP